MDRYQKVEKPKGQASINENELRITAQGRMRNYISYALSLLQDKGVNEIVLKATGRAINKAVMIAELIKRRIVGLHQNTTTGSIDITDTWEPLEEGLLPLETTRHVSIITITLSKKELDFSSTGYQPPLPADQVKPLAEYDDEETSPGNQGKGRGVQRRNGGIPKSSNSRKGKGRLLEEDFPVKRPVTRSYCRNPNNLVSKSDMMGDEIESRLQEERSLVDSKLLAMEQHLGYRLVQMMEQISALVVSVRSCGHPAGPHGSGSNSATSPTPDTALRPPSFSLATQDRTNAPTQDATTSVAGSFPAKDPCEYPFPVSHLAGYQAANTAGGPGGFTHPTAFLAVSPPAAANGLPPGHPHLAAPFAAGRQLAPTSAAAWVGGQPPVPDLGFRQPVVPRYTKIDFPTYDGRDDPLIWAHRYELFFEIQSTLETEKV